MDILNSILSLLTETWVLLVIGASFMFAGSDYLDEELLKRKKQKVGTLVIISSSFGLVLSLVFFTSSFWTHTSLILSPSTTLQALGVGFLEALWVIPYLKAMRRRSGIVIGPMLQIIPVIALLFEAGIIGLIPPVIQIAGALLIVIGGIILSIEREEDEDGQTSHSIDWGTVALMMLSSALVALIYVLFKGAADHTNYVAVGFWSGLGMAGTGFLIWLVWSPYRQAFNEFRENANGKNVMLQFVNEVMDSGGAYLTHLANTLGPSIMVVTAFNASQPIAIALLYFLIALYKREGDAGEEAHHSRWFQIGMAIALIAVGLVLLALN